MSQFKRWDRLIETVKKERHAGKIRTAFSVPETVPGEMKSTGRGDPRRIYKKDPKTGGTIHVNTKNAASN